MADRATHKAEQAQGEQRRNHKQSRGKEDRRALSSRPADQSRGKELPGHCSLAGVARGRGLAEEVHEGGAAWGRGPTEAVPRRGEEEAGPRGRRRCPGRRGSSRTGRDVQGRAVPRGRGDARGCGVAVAPPGEFSRALFSVSPSSLFPSVD